MLAERPKPNVDPGVAENVMPPTVSLGVEGSPPSTVPRRRTEATTLTAILSRGGNCIKTDYGVLKLMAHAAR